MAEETHRFFWFPGAANEMAGESLSHPRVRHLYCEEPFGRGHVVLESFIYQRKEQTMARSGSRRTGSSESARGATSQIYDDILSLAGSLIGSRKQRGAESLSSLAEATREYGANLEIPHVSAYVSSAADQLDYLSEYMSGNNLETMVADAGDFAKRHPAAALGLAAAAGFGITRLMSMRHEQRSSNGRGSGAPGRGIRSRRKPPSRSAAVRGGRNSHSRTSSEDMAAANA
jgi:ElaB/YqjD/DUF883 family membrane-anchored ribosome-binding protein